MKTPSIASLVFTWLALLALLAVTTASAYLDLGAGNTVLNLIIAAIKVALIAVFFMHLGRADGAVHIAAGAALFFLFILAFLAFGDVLTRPSHSTPWRAPLLEASGTEAGLTY
ncbi:MAG TPA: cytochrome C oxidase subunit IV family protein [Steroidobacteraceae bacterium]|nr:cytochrome C oxidase subunit IV family protein [Steroidobacteraceae bacterium]